MPSKQSYVDRNYLERAGQLLAPIKLRSHELMSIQTGQRLLDLGCGPGIDTVILGQQVGPTGSVVGIDMDPEMVEAADTAARLAEVGSWVSHRVDDAERPSLGPGQFDAARSERLFMHLAQPALALRAMIDATRSGGRVVVTDPDWGSLSIDCEERETERALARCRADQGLPNGYSGRRLRAMFLAAGLRDVTVEAHAVVMTDYGLARFITRMDAIEDLALDTGRVSREQLIRWRHALTAIAESGAFYGATTLVVAAGRVP